MLSIQSMYSTIYQYWDNNNVFKLQQVVEKDSPVFEFYEGPPFATGTPHYGHILNGCIKDTICRFHWLNGQKVKRIAGWDTHGLPIEFKIEEKLGIKTKQEVESFGIDKYNMECRSIVLECVDSWKQMMRKLGRWIDFDNAYMTMSKEYMNSVWSVFSQIYDKGLIHRGFRVMPFSLSCGTPLSNFEASSNYKDISDISATVKFFVKELESYILVWTTTPWTLPSNMALCVNTDITYVKITNSDGEHIICSKVYYVQNPTLSSKYTIVSEFNGDNLVNKQYEPLFNYQKNHTNYTILTDSFVSTDKGTGIVHLAPAFGEDDFKVCLKYNIINNDFSNLYCPINDNGYFDNTVIDYQGRHIFDCVSDICSYLKSHNLLFKKESFVHSYPHCWRSETKLIYRAVDSWFVAVSQINDLLLKNNAEVNWTPNHVGHRRFHEWLSNARDWNISRKRYWGCPIPIWVNDETGKILVIKSINELQKYTNNNLTDIHREHIDDITITIDGLLYKRIPDVFDCWFESGAMPFARDGLTKFTHPNVADFISEGLDQTRGWFYTLLVISTILQDKSPFKNVIVNGLVLAEDGKKMSKSKQNYTDPNEIIDKYGSDTLRLYLISSPASESEPLRFKDSDVFNVNKTIFIPIMNSLKYLKDYTEKYINNSHLTDENINICKLYEHIYTTGSIPENVYNQLNIYDKFIIQTLNNFRIDIHNLISTYKLNNIHSLLEKFIDKLNNSFIKFKRDDFKNPNAYVPLTVLYYCIYWYSITTLSLSPFTSEYLYMELHNLLEVKCEYKSIHLIHKPNVLINNLPVINIDLSLFDIIQRVIDELRQFRTQNNYPHRRALHSIRVKTNSTSIDWNKVFQISDNLNTELNVNNIIVDNDAPLIYKQTYIPNYKKYGPDYKLKFNSIINSINDGSVYMNGDKKLVKLINKDSIEETIDIVFGEHLYIKNEVIEPYPNTIYLNDYNTCIEIDTVLTSSIRNTYVSTYLRYLIQSARKTHKLTMIDNARVVITTTDNELTNYFNSCLFNINIDNTSYYAETKECLPDGQKVNIVKLKEDTDYNYDKDFVITLTKL